MKQHTPNYDVVVVGAGPSGATAAYLLAINGYRVCLVDKKQFPRPKLCAGLLTWKSIDLLLRIFGYSNTDLMDQGVISHKCRNYRIYHGPKLLIQRRLDFPFHFVDRLKYDDFWLHQARKAGCHIKTGITVSEVDPICGVISSPDGWRLKAETIIGADGVWSKVRRSLMAHDTPNKKWRRQLAATIETRQACTTAPNSNDYAAIHLGYMHWGYAWSFPGKCHQVLGMGGLHRKGRRSMAQDFRDFLSAIDSDKDRLGPLQSHPLPYGNHLRHPARGRVLLVGDACGLADPLLGEGIYYAHRSGELAAQAIIAARSSSTQATTLYNQALNTHILNEFRWIKRYRNLLFIGGHRSQLHGLKLFFRLMPERLEAAVQGQLSFSKLLWPGHRPRAVL